MRTITELWRSLGNLDWRMATTIALGCAAPMVVMWFLAPTVDVIATALGAPSGGGGTFRWAWFVPYPVPFTGRAATGIALMLGVPLGTLALWALARRTHGAPRTRTR